MLKFTKRDYKLLLVAIMCILIVSACQEDSTTAPFPGFEIIRENGQVSIKDQKGKIWNITHAVEKYGFIPENFQYGLGPYAFLPINDPQFLSPGDVGYPAAANDVIVIGYKDENITRAYSLNILVHHEIVNDMFHDVPVAVGY
jgi:hypothetical protein